MTILDDAIALDNVAKFLQWIAEKWHKQRDETGSQLQVRYHPSPLICQHLSNNDQYHALDTAHKALNGEQAETVIFAPPLTRQSPSQWDATANVTQIVENVWVRDGDTRRWLYSEIMKMRRHELYVVRNLVCSFLFFHQEEEGMVAGFSLRAILGYLNSDDINGLQGGVRLTKARYK